MPVRGRRIRRPLALAALGLLTALSVSIPLAVPPALAEMLSPAGGYLIDWCEPNDCDPDRTFEEGMTVAHFKAAGGECGPENNSNISSSTPYTKMINTKGGWTNPEGFLIGYKSDIRWSLGEPVWCTNRYGVTPTSVINNVRIPIRYFVYGTDRSWNCCTVSAGANIALGQATNPDNTYLTLTCIGSTGTVNQYKQGGGSGASAQIMTGGTRNASTGQISDRPMSTDGKFSYDTWYFQFNAAQLLALNSLTTCTSIRSITVEFGNAATPDVTTVSKREWTAAYAMRGVERIESYGEDIDCDDLPTEVVPAECGDIPTSPAGKACKKFNFIDGSTWKYFLPCVIGGPEDYAVTVETITNSLPDSALPLPGSGSCSAWTPGSFNGTSITFNPCPWYTPWRPAVDAVMTAGLWAAVAAQIFRFMAGTKGDD